MVQSTRRGRPNGAVLSLRGMTSHDYMTIDGGRYMLAPVDSYGLRKRAELNELIRRIGELEKLAAAGRASENDEREYDTRMRELVVYALPKLPQKLVERMTPGECQQVAGAFFVWLAKTQSGLFEAARWLIGSSPPDSAPPTAPASG